MYNPVPSVPYYLLNFNFNNLIRVGGGRGGGGVHVLPPIWHNKQEEGRIKP